MWQPIKTAPKGSCIDVLIWDGYRVRIAYRVMDGGAWHCLEDDDTPYRDPMLYQPTHWMPLPEPP